MGFGIPKGFDRHSQEKELTLLTRLLSDQSSHLKRGIYSSLQDFAQGTQACGVSSVWRKVWNGVSRGIQKERS